MTQVTRTLFLDIPLDSLRQALARVVGLPEGGVTPRELTLEPAGAAYAAGPARLAFGATATGSRLELSQELKDGLWSSLVVRPLVWAAFGTLLKGLAEPARETPDPETCRLRSAFRGCPDNA